MKPWMKASLAAVIATILIYSCSKDNDLWSWMIPETEDTTTSAQINGYVFRPALVPASEENVKNLKVPAGFTVAKFADHLGKPRILAISPAGNVYFSDREAGVVTLLKDNNGDGVSDSKQVVANIRQAHGLTIHNGSMYIAAVREVYVASINSDGTLGQPSVIISNLPDGGQHPNRTLAFGPDGMLYITVGSTCNACPESNPMNATIVRANANGSNMIIYAKGLRNTIGFGWHPGTGELWGMDHGIDWLGDDDQKEEVNQIKQNGNYGWPYIYGEGKYNPADRPQGDTTYEQYLRLTTCHRFFIRRTLRQCRWHFTTARNFPLNTETMLLLPCGDPGIAARL